MTSHVLLDRQLKFMTMRVDPRGQEKQLIGAINAPLRYLED